MVLKLINKLLGVSGYKIEKTKNSAPPLPPDIEADEMFMRIYDKVKDFTMTSIERIYILHKAVLHLAEQSTDGAFVECGVWRGGSTMMMALTLKELGRIGNEIYLYDTFEGMTEPTEVDKHFGGSYAKDLYDKHGGVWCYSALEEVRQNMASTGYPAEKIHYIKGKVEDTIPGVCPPVISLLRLDTDWYESTKHELIHLYSNLIKGGILIIDDFGYWEGSKKAVLEYFEKEQKPPFLSRIDSEGRLIVK